VAGAGSLRFGARRERGVTHFAIHARAAHGVALDLFEAGAERAFTTVALERDQSEPEPFSVWRTELRGLPERFEYLYRVDGGAALIDPYAPVLSGGEVWGRSQDALGPGIGRRYRGLVVPPVASPETARALRPAIDPARRVIYELHVRGFTRHGSSGVARPGTYPGIVEKIPHLLELGVTTVELMPVFEFDETENPRRDPATGARLLNFWGYSPVSFFAPKAAFAADPSPGAAARELAALVDELHRAGLEVVFDVVYNHTAEGGGGAGDPAHSWRGLDARAYYLGDPATGRALDLTGCGNTVNLNHPVTRRLVLDSLRHWVEAYGVDGFRFDLAAVLYRGDRGQPLERSPLVEEIGADPLLAGRLLIAEPWDATGFSPAAGFPAPWLEWDGEMRDALRRFAGGLEPDPRPLARRLGGRGPQGGRLPAGRAVRFVACHDGRPLADVVAFARKHNEANGEGNRDGWDGEVAWNGGVEGPSDDPEIAARRAREVRLLLALLAAAPGAIQLTAGDELGRTQRGNTNAWCQDNEIGWVTWPGPRPPAAGAGTSDRSARALAAYVSKLLQLRKRLAPLLTGSSALIEPLRASGADPSLELLALPSFLMLRTGGGGEEAWLLAVNAGAEARRFPLPRAPAGRAWRLRVDTARGPGGEVDLGAAPFFADETWQIEVAPRAARWLVAEPRGDVPA